MSRLPEQVLGVVGFALMTIGWTGFLTTVPLSELVSIDNAADGWAIIFVWLQGAVLLVLAVVLAVVRRHSRSGDVDAVRWPWPPARTAVGVGIIVATAATVGPLFALPLLLVAAVVTVRRGSGGDGRGTGWASWLDLSVLLVMISAGVYGVVFGAPGVVAYSVEVLVASAGLAQPAGVTAPPLPALSLWGPFIVLTVSWVVLLTSDVMARRTRRADVIGGVS
ncbi:hypothetical protein [Jannaschia sp. R86511]|uniref:hypothetical protein n=1 Tax=Jannaschia sp. R86511 TaxID=3093853 RepID=UPI0036D40E66